MKESWKNFNNKDEQIINLLKENGFLPYIFIICDRNFDEIGFKNIKQSNDLFIKDLDLVNGKCPVK